MRSTLESFLKLVATTKNPHMNTFQNLKEQKNLIWNLFYEYQVFSHYEQASLSSEIARMYDSNVFSSTYCP